jgi:hypothetical protein
VCYITVAWNHRWFRYQVIIVKYNLNGWWPAEDTTHWFKFMAERAKRRIMR